MDKATIAAVMGTILGLFGGVVGMQLFASPGQDNAEVAHLESRVADLNNTLAQYGEERNELKQKLEAEQRQVQASAGYAAELERVARDKATAEAQAAEHKSELDTLKVNSAEELRQRDARIRRLERVLNEHGIVDHLTDEEVAGQVTRLAEEFQAGLKAGNKDRALGAFHELQRYGPRAWDRVIELWYELPLMVDEEADAPTVELTREELEGLISQFGLLRMALTDPEVPPDFRVYALFSMHRFDSREAAERAKLAGDVLLRSESFEAEAAITALADIGDVSVVRYLADFVGTDRRSTEARLKAVDVLARHETAAALEALEDAAENDPEEAVRERAAGLLDDRFAPVAGVRITWVDDEGQAALAGMRVGDILTHYNGKAVGSISSIIAERDRAEDAEAVELTVYREGDTLELRLAPGALGINGVAVQARD
jgi:hypothetical protein